MVEEKKQQLGAGQLDLLYEMDAEEAVVSSSEAVVPPLEVASAPQPLPIALPCFTPEASISLPEMLLIIDTETTGLDPKQDHCLEVGAILFHAPRRAVLAQHSFLLPVQDNSAELINRTTNLIPHVCCYVVCENPDLSAIGATSVV